MRGECELALDRREQRVARARESDEERVALGVDLVPAVSLTRCPQQTLMIREHLRITLAKLLDEPRRPLDIGEEEGDGAGRWLGHHTQA